MPCRAFRPYKDAPGARKIRRKPVGVDELARRFDQCLDLWTGQPLTGTDKENWERIQEEGRLAAQARANRIMKQQRDEDDDECAPLCTGT